MKVKIAQVIGLNSDQKAALVISESQDSEHTFLSVLELACDDAFTRGRQVLSELSDFYFEFDGSAADKLNATFAQGLKKLEPVGSFDLLAGSVSGKILYLIGQGGVEVYLKRGSKLSPLLSLGSQQQLISGFLQGEDRLLLATKNLTSFLSDELSDCLDLEIDAFEEDVSNRLGGAKLEDQGLAGLLVEVETEAAGEEIPSHVITPETSIKTSKPVLNFAFLSAIFGRIGKILPKRMPKEGYLDYGQSKFNLTKFIPKSGRGRLILALFLIILIGAGIGLKYKDTRDKQKQLLFAQTLQQAKDDFNAARGLKDLNPEDAKNKWDAAKNQVDKALTLLPKSQEARDFKKQIEQDESVILQQFTSSNFPAFLELDLIKKNFRAEKMSLSAGKLLVLDPAVKTLVVVDISKKSQVIIAGQEQLGDAILSSINGAFAFTYSKDKGVIRTDITNQKQTVIAKTDNDWGVIADIAGFAGNIYVLDSAKNQIWKYLPVRQAGLPAANGFSDKRNYLNDGVKVDFGDAIRMQIESSIYVLKANGEIIRLTKGASDNFSYSGIPGNVKAPKSFFVSSDTDNLYLLDSGNSRLLVLTKTGAFKAQYQGDKFASAPDLVVDEIGKKVYLLDSGKIYSVDLK